MEEKTIHDELSSIRNLMERSSKFISLSGLSGILAGIYALIGAAIAYNMIYTGHDLHTRDYVMADVPSNPGVLVKLFFVALAILLLSITSGVLLSKRKAKKKGQQFWGKTSKALLFHMAVPLVTGGLLMMILVYRGYYGIVAPASLIFYGLALLGASNFTFGDVKYLGILEIVLGLGAGCFPGYGLYFWAMGFGVLHIVYGSIMYFKYDG